MTRQKLRPGATRLAAASLASAVLAITGCSTDAPDTADQAQAATGENGTATPIAQLPFVDSASNTQLVGELLARPTALGETTALHVRLPAPRNAELAQSLIRVVGPADSPQILFRSDALVQLGLIRTSPGKEFFTAFSTLPPSQLDVLKRNIDQIASGVFGEPTTQSVLFNGRSAVGRAINATIDPSIFTPGGGFIPVNRCSIRPTSTLAAWGKSLFITDPAVVLDPARTWDPCTGAGTKGGVWTFAHFIREMANGSGKTPEDFATDWLSLWLNNYVVNADTVGARTQMFSQVIQPWAVASGVTASLGPDATGKLVVTLSGPLKLDIAPFRLNAIVNRIDLGGTVSGPTGYSGTVTSKPTTAGELRFIFNVVQPVPWGAGTEASCGRKHFTTIFEYGVPITGCTAVVAWAKKWTQLQAFPGFSPAYLAQLQAMTESVVVHGAAPTKGNQNAINQIRTNEIALSPPWELREFTLTDEQPTLGTDLPASGELRPHTVAQTPNDGAFSAFGPDATINSFVNGAVTAGVVLPVVNPGQCAASYTVPYFFGTARFRGGNALVGPGHWNSSTVNLGSPAANICARHELSLNTCGGCHRDDSGTNGLGGSTSFTHIDPVSPIPVKLSKFLTGGGPGLVFNVNDTQLGAPTWQFADLERRFQRLFDLSHCTSCTTLVRIDPAILAQLEKLGPVPIDPGPLDAFPFRVGPITDLGTMRSVLDLRARFAGGTFQDTVDFVRPIESFAE